MSRTLSNALQNAFRNPGKSVTFNGTAKLRLINGQQLVSVKSPSFMAIHNDKIKFTGHQIDKSGLITEVRYDLDPIFAQYKAGINFNIII